MPEQINSLEDAGINLVGLQEQIQGLQIPQLEPDKKIVKNYKAAIIAGTLADAIAAFGGAQTDYADGIRAQIQLEHENQMQGKMAEFAQFEQQRNLLGDQMNSIMQQQRFQSDMEMSAISAKKAQLDVDFLEAEHQAADQTRDDRLLAEQAELQAAIKTAGPAADADVARSNVSAIQDRLATTALENYGRTGDIKFLQESLAIRGGKVFSGGEKIDWLRELGNEQIPELVGLHRKLSDPAKAGISPEERQLLGNEFENYVAVKVGQSTPDGMQIKNRFSTFMHQLQQHPKALEEGDPDKVGLGEAGLGKRFTEEAERVIYDRLAQTEAQLQILEEQGQLTLEDKAQFEQEKSKIIREMIPRVWKNSEKPQEMDAGFFTSGFALAGQALSPTDVFSGIARDAQLNVPTASDLSASPLSELSRKKFGFETRLKLDERLKGHNFPKKKTLSPYTQLVKEYKKAFSEAS